MNTIKALFLSLLLALVFPAKDLQAQDQVQDQARRQHQTRDDQFAAADVQSLSITNRHGSIFYTGWDKEEVTVRVRIWVEAPNQTLAEEVLGLISVLQVPGGKQVDYRTVFADEFFSNYPFGIDYHIYGPDTLGLKLVNRLGKIQLENYKGRARVELNFGNFEISDEKSLPDSLQLQLTNGNLNLQQVRTANIHHRNGKATLAKAEQLQLQADFSTIHLKQVQDLQLEATTSHLQIEEAAHIQGHTSNSDLEIAYLVRGGFLEMERGEIQIKRLSNALHELTLAGSHTTMHLHTDKNMDYNLHGQIIDGKLHFPDSKQITILRENNLLTFSAEAKQRPANRNAPALILLNNNSDIHVLNK